MNIKIKAFELYNSGWSYGRVAKELGIGKTTAYDYIKEVKLTGKPVHYKPVPTHSEPVRNPDSERVNADLPAIAEPLEKPITKPVKEFTGDELIEKKFDSLEFKGKFLDLIGKPSKLFSGIIWGLPKGGKSNFSIRFADYLQEYFGDVVYVAAEEGESVTLQEKIKAIGGSKVTFAENKDRNAIREYLRFKLCDFVFIDSINNAGIDNEFLETLKQENPGKSFTSIVQATKGGNFKGDQALTHNCDFIIKVVQGVASHSGRFNTSTEINIFDEPLYEKNKSARQKKEIIDSKPKIESSPISTNEITFNAQLDDVTPEKQEEVSLSIEEILGLGDSYGIKQIVPVKGKNVIKSKPVSGNTDANFLWLALGVTALSILDNVITSNKKKNQKK